MQLPKLDEKLEAETWPGVHVRFFLEKNIRIRNETFQKTSHGDFGTGNERRSVHKHSLTPAFRLHRTELEASADSLDSILSVPSILYSITCDISNILLDKNRTKQILPKRNIRFVRLLHVSLKMVNHKLN